MGADEEREDGAARDPDGEPDPDAGRGPGAEGDEGGVTDPDGGRGPAPERDDAPPRREPDEGLVARLRERVMRVMHRSWETLLRGTSDEDRETKEQLARHHRRGWEVAVMATMVASVALIGVGALFINLDPTTLGLGRQGRLLHLVFAAGLVSLAASLFLAHPIETFRALYPQVTGGTRYDQLRFWTRYKTVGILLSLLVLMGVAVLLVSVLSRIDVLTLEELPFQPVLRATTGLTLAIGIAAGYALYLSLRTPVERGESYGFEAPLFYGAAVASLFFAGQVALLAMQDVGVLLLRFTVLDIPFLMLSGITAASVALIVSRSVPTVTILLAEEADPRRTKGYLSRRKSIYLPAVAAFAMLFIVVMVVFVFGLGVVSIVEEIPQNVVLIGVFGFVVAALLVSVGVTFLLSRSEDEVPLYKRKIGVEARKRIVLLSVSAVATAVLFAVALMTLADQRPLDLARLHWVDVFSVGLLAAVGPYGFYIAAKRRRVRNLEARFPDFLRDLSSNHRAGLTLTNSVVVASRGDYGPLTPDVVKMAEQLSWNVPFSEALRRFAERVNTPLVHRAVSLIQEANRTGGNVTDVLVAAARDAREIKNMENERRTNMSLYTAIIYITFFVFLAVAAIMFGTFIPEIVAAVESVQQLGAGAGGVGGLKFTLLSMEDYRTFYFLAALVQAVGNGMIAGIIETGEYDGGLRHAFIMVVVTLVVFALLPT